MKYIFVILLLLYNNISLLSSEASTYQCTIDPNTCTKKYESKNAFRQHLSNDHGSSLTCLHCNAEFQYYQDLKEHSITTHNHRLSNQIDLNPDEFKHIFGFSRYQMYKCSFSECKDNKFNGWRTLVVHLKSQHNQCLPPQRTVRRNPDQYHQFLLPQDYTMVTNTVMQNVRNIARNLPPPTF